jgi:hypothetical protein
MNAVPEPLLAAVVAGQVTASEIFAANVSWVLGAHEPASPAAPELLAFPELPWPPEAAPFPASAAPPDAEGAPVAASAAPFAPVPAGIVVSEPPVPLDAFVPASEPEPLPVSVAAAPLPPAPRGASTWELLDPPHAVTSGGRAGSTHVKESAIVRIGRRAIIGCLASWQSVE